MFGIASTTAQVSILESLLTAKVYAGVSLLTKWDGAFSNSNVLYFGMANPQYVPSSQKLRRNQEKRAKCPFFLSLDPNTCFPVEGRRGTQNMLNLNFESVFLFDILFSSNLSSYKFEVFLVNEALPLATCFARMPKRLIFGILKQIQIRVLNEFKQIIFY